MRFPGELNKQRERLLSDPVLGIVEKKPLGVYAQVLTSLTVIIKKLAQVDALDGLVVFAKSAKAFSMGKGSYAGHGFLAWGGCRSSRANIINQSAASDKCPAARRMVERLKSGRQSR